MSDDAVPGDALPDEPPPETADLHGAYPRLSDAQIQSLERFGERRPTRRGEILIREGERSTHFFVLLSGQAIVLSGYPRDPRV
ncbi:MAG: thioredoxin reductase, partial [Pseudonocardiales bacterium]|nr:thioredoxin reductase [Pseudonocardiales bacterium]